MIAWVSKLKIGEYGMHETGEVGSFEKEERSVSEKTVFNATASTRFVGAKAVPKKDY